MILVEEISIQRIINIILGFLHFFHTWNENCTAVATHDLRKRQDVDDSACIQSVGTPGISKPSLSSCFLRRDYQKLQTLTGLLKKEKESAGRNVTSLSCNCLMGQTLLGIFFWKATPLHAFCCPSRPRIPRKWYA